MLLFVITYPNSKITKKLHEEKKLNPTQAQRASAVRQTRPRWDSLFVYWGFRARRQLRSFCAHQVGQSCGMSDPSPCSHISSLPGYSGYNDRLADGSIASRQRTETARPPAVGRRRGGSAGSVHTSSPADAVQSSSTGHRLGLTPEGVGQQEAARAGEGEAIDRRPPGAARRQPGRGGAGVAPSRRKDAASRDGEAPGADSTADRALLRPAAMDMASALERGDILARKQ